MSKPKSIADDSQLSDFNRDEEEIREDSRETLEYLDEEEK